MPFLDFYSYLHSSDGWKQIWNIIVWAFENQIIIKYTLPGSKEVQKYANVISIAKVIRKIIHFHCNKNILLKKDQCKFNNKVLKETDLI